MSAGNKRVAIKTLVEFAAKAGSLDSRFTPAPSGQEGIDGHKQLTRRRHADYQTELSLSIDYGGITFRGRADGYDPRSHCLEEIKTFYGDVTRIPENHQHLHWAQVKCYGWLYCAQNGCEDITLALIYFELLQSQEYPLEETWSASALREYFEQLAESYCRWQAQLSQHQQQLHAWLERLTFPYADMHAAQRSMAETVYKAAALGRVVLAEAPTGTGKTLAALFPALKSLSRTAVDKIFYLTAKATGKQLALDNIRHITGEAQVPLRTLELTAREKACLAPDKKCRGDSCPYARDFYHKLTQARQAAFELPLLDKDTLATLAQDYEICPFYLGLEMSRWVDLIVADVNYFFDGTPLLIGLSEEFGWKPCVLVDECHNLIDRGRSMFTAELRRSDLLAAKKLAPVPIKHALKKVNRSWRALIKSLPTEPLDFALLSSPPKKFAEALLAYTQRHIAFLLEHPDHILQEGLPQEVFFAARNYLRVFELLDEDFCIDMQDVGSRQEVLTLRNLIPARLLAKNLNLAHCACLFSATLQPPHYYRTLLGLPNDTVVLHVPSPFAAEQLSVNIATQVSTRYKDRQAAIAPLCAIVHQQLQAEPGNALIFFSSYEFLQQAEQPLRRILSGSDIEILVQTRHMTEKDRELFVAQFRQHTRLLGLAVLGGSFSEGIDLAGDALKGAFIATLGLPPLNPLNEHLRKIMEGKFGQGYNFTYLFPGIQKVIQAAGRVIRKESDCGYLWLLDQRFQQPEIQSLLPAWWRNTKES